VDSLWAIRNRSKGGGRVRRSVRAGHPSKMSGAGAIQKGAQRPGAVGRPSGAAQKVSGVNRPRGRTGAEGGFLISASTVLIYALGYIGTITMLHFWGKFMGAGKGASATHSEL